MDKLFNTPAEIYTAMVNTGVAKSKLSILKMIVLGILAGAYIAFGAYGFIVFITTSTFDPGLAKYIGAAIFPVGLMMVVIGGAELFTGNCLMTLAVMDKKITGMQMLRNWLFVYIGNIIGSYLLAWILSSTGLMSDAIVAKATAIATAKVGLSFGVAFARAILCNILVVMAVWLAAGAKDVVGKVFAILFPIALFVFCGYEHSVANMFFIPLAQFSGAAITTGAMWLNNILPVTLGNIIGGAVIIPICYQIAYGAKKEKPQA